MIIKTLCCIKSCPVKYMKMTEHNTHLLSRVGVQQSVDLQQMHQFTLTLSALFFSRMMMHLTRRTKSLKIHPQERDLTSLALPECSPGPRSGWKLEKMVRFKTPTCKADPEAAVRESWRWRRLLGRSQVDESVKRARGGATPLALLVPEVGRSSGFVFHDSRMLQK